MNNGSIGVVRGGSVGKFIPGHKKIIYAMCSNKDYSRLFTGGADGKIIIWNDNLKPI